MNASAIITDDMTLEEKLSAIDTAMQAAQEAAEEQAAKSGTVVAPFDPALATICDGCEQLAKYVQNRALTVAPYSM